MNTPVYMYYISSRKRWSSTNSPTAIADSLAAPLNNQPLAKKPRYNSILYMKYT